ncbi:MAG: transporter substrate-binding domain-containing protein [Cyclobacteriaceae bacterium]
MRSILFVCSVLMVSLFSCSDNDVNDSKFSKEELEWLKENPIITLAVDNTYPPLNFVDDNGEMAGVNIDLIRIIEKKLGVTIQLKGGTWDESLQRALSHEVDGIINATALDERKDRLNFTIDFMADPQTLICNKEFNHNGKLEDFRNSKIAVKRNSTHYNLLAAKFIKSNLVEVETVLDGIKLLSVGQVDAVYDDFAPIYHLITTNNLNNLSIVFVESQISGAGIGLRNDEPLMLSVFEKAIASIDESEIIEIKENWLNISPKFNLLPIYIGFGVLIAVVIGGLIWNSALSSQVASRTAQLKKELTAKEKAQAELTAHKEQLEEIVEKRTTELKVTNDELIKTNKEIVSQRDKLEHAYLELKETQEKLIQSEKLASLGVFTAGIAHEINNPVNYITSGTNVLFDIIDNLKTNPNGLQEKFDEINTVRSAINMGIEKTVSIVSSLRNYAHSDETNFVDYNIIDCIDDALLLLNNSYKYHIQIEKDLPNEVIINCLPGKINQVFVNLINNAIQAIDKEGMISIKGSLTRTNVYFEISDTGHGIDQKNLASLFDPFFTTKDAGKGSGLGLYIVHGIVKQHNGEISVQSTVDVGSTFLLEFPLVTSS